MFLKNAIKDALWGDLVVQESGSSYISGKVVDGLGTILKMKEFLHFLSKLRES